MNIAIIGAGASSIFLQALLRDKHNIYVFERNKKILSKLKASGNGRCNMLNAFAIPEDYNNKEFMNQIFKKIGPDKILKIFNDFGLITTQDLEGRVYPISNISETVSDIMLENVRSKIILDYTVEKITKKNNKYIINDYNVEFDKVILATGSSASIIPSKQSICYDYLKSLNINITKLNPSLVGFKNKQGFKDISGVRLKALVKLYIDNKFIREERGEVIFKDDGISGIVIMNMSSYYNRYNKKNAYLVLDMLEGINPKNIKGAFNPKLYRYILNNNIDYHNFRIDILDTYDIKDAQVINGGVDLNSINDNLSLKNDNNIYLMGEMLNIDGVCGGYNLLFAFMCAYVVGCELGYEDKN